MNDTPFKSPLFGRPDIRFIADRLAERVHGLEQALNRLSGKSSDAEAIHDVRVACRRLVGGLDACRDETGEKKRVRRLRGKLQALRRGLGAAREAEVGLTTLEKLSGALTPEEEILIGFLGASLSREIGLVSDGDPTAAGGSSITSRARKLVLRLLKPSLDATSESPEVLMENLRSRAMVVMRARREVLLERPREPLNEGDDAALHQLRVDGKKLRYAMEFYEPLFPSRMAGRLRLLKQLQDTLGDAHDLADLGHRVRDLAEGMPSAHQRSASNSCRMLADRIEQRRRKTLEPLGKFLRAIEHPGFLPAVPAEEHEGAPAETHEEQGGSAPNLRVINSDDGDETGRQGNG